jgi:hypothetical protein
MAKRIPIELSEDGDEKLRQLKLKRSYDLGRIVSKDFVIEELINREIALDKAGQYVVKATEEMFEQRLFGSQD